MTSLSWRPLGSSRSCPTCEKCKSSWGAQQPPRLPAPHPSLLPLSLPLPPAVSGTGHQGHSTDQHEVRLSLSCPTSGGSYVPHLLVSLPLFPLLVSAPSPHPASTSEGGGGTWTWNSNAVGVSGTLWYLAFRRGLQWRGAPERNPQLLSVALVTESAGLSRVWAKDPHAVTGFCSAWLRVVPTLSPFVGVGAKS